jgi:hypothetical protein
MDNVCILNEKTKKETEYIVNALCKILRNLAFLELAVT